MPSKEHFIILAGECDQFHAEMDSLPDRGQSLIALQESQSRRGYIPAELVLSIYGWTVRYASGLQGFGILRKADSFNPENALRWAREWVARDPKSREVWVRRSAVERAEKDGHDCSAIKALDTE